MDEREQILIKYRDRTLEEAGKALDVSRERARQLYREYRIFRVNVPPVVQRHHELEVRQAFKEARTNADVHHRLGIRPPQFEILRDYYQLESPTDRTRRRVEAREAAGYAWCYGHQDWIKQSRFYRNRQTRTGRQHYCIECQRPKLTRSYVKRYGRYPSRRHTTTDPDRYRLEGFKAFQVIESERARLGLSKQMAAQKAGIHYQSYLYWSRAKTAKEFPLVHRKNHEHLKRIAQRKRPLQPTWQERVLEQISGKKGVTHAED